MEEQNAILTQYIDSMIDVTNKIEKAQNENNIEEFNKLKQFILSMQNQIKAKIG